MNQKLIVIDGKTYRGVEEMPPDIRAKYEEAMRNFDQNRSSMPDLLESTFKDQNQNGLPDALENMASIQNLANNLMGATKFVVDGQTYDSLDQLPPEARAKYEQAMGRLDANHNGIPDFVEGMFQAPTQNANRVPVSSVQTPAPPRSQPIPVGQTIEPESSGGWMIALAGIALIGLCLVAAAAGVWYFFFR